VVALLIARHANLTLLNSRMARPVDIAMENKDASVLMLFAALDRDTLCNAVATSVDFIQRLLDDPSSRYDPRTIRSSRDATPLHVAARLRSDCAVIDKLIEIGIDIDARDVVGDTCTHIAVSTNNFEALCRFVAAGANLDIPDMNGETPLHITVYDRDGHFALLLLAAGASVWPRNRAGQTACFQFAKHGALLAVHASFASGANFDEPDNAGVTPRQLAAKRSIELPPRADQLESVRRRMVAIQLSLVRERAFEICVALQLLGLDALRTIEILRHACGPVAPLLPFHLWWKIVTTIKHFRT
jgi:hypothetical protein